MFYQQEEARADYGKTLEELIFPLSFNESDELKDVKERQKAVPIRGKYVYWKIEMVKYILF